MPADETTTIPTIRSLRELTELVQLRPGLFVRWSAGPDQDGPGSVDGLSGIQMPGVSCNGLDPEPWWDGLPVEVWVARKLHEYSPQRSDRGGSGMAWVLAGDVVGRGPDNEPLLRRREVVAYVDDAVLDEADAVVQARSDR